MSEGLATHGSEGDRAARWHSLFQAKGSLIALCYLRSAGPSARYGIARGIGLSKEAVAHAVGVLEALGLCETFREPEFPFRLRTRITDLGSQLVETRVMDLQDFARRFGRADAVPHTVEF
jgi:DNA-binding HxlR family transcriptional regulator